MTASEHHASLVQLFLDRGGYATAAEVTEAGIPRVELTRLVRSGSILRLARGVYRLTSPDGLAPADAEATDLLEVQLRYPYARPCLVSALHLHGLTTTRPSRLQLAVPGNRQELHLEGLLLETFYFSAGAYQAGVTEIDVRGRPLTTYTAEKTLVDLLRYAPKFGRDLYLEGLKKALTLRTVDRRHLTSLARELKVWKELSRDLEVLSHDQDH
ncbi:type IV toxin-antitoxin system AbiEi family antitoxin domain-containing protein [Deinococcus aestuarii]|uniref:type IV toxin-antitoxin system AbiEi family antitoxin domain-containing protein n=1 Tax=Deinococcus aestuarii TaxID=2774531 RepID=UPI001C0D4EA4|nr:type IV toxin-antitoxin system AbiEi family antitoxin domain-containing protein [Deinococcus aestuarii]